MQTDPAQESPPAWTARFARVADRWVWVFMTGLFVATALAGFVPSSLERLRLIEAGQQPPFPLSTHVHAVTMGAWLLLSLAQALLVALGRPRWHRALGRAAFVLGPAVVISLTVTTVHFLLAQRHAWTLAQLSDQFAFALFVQGKVTLLFALYLAWALRVRSRAPQLHKRLVLLATFALIAAAFSRIPWLPHFGLEWPYHEDLWNVLILAPVLLYDALRSPRWLWVWLLGIVLMWPFMAAYYWLGLGLPPWWLQFVAELFGRTP